MADGLKGDATAKSYLEEFDAEESHTRALEAITMTKAESAYAVRVFCQHARALQFPAERLAWLALPSSSGLQASSDIGRAMCWGVYDDAVGRRAREWNRAVMDVWMALQLPAVTDVRAGVAEFLVPSSISYLGPALCAGLRARLRHGDVRPAHHGASGGAGPRGDPRGPAGEPGAVIQEVEHPDEPVAERDEALLQVQADQDWAESVARAIRERPEPPARSSKVYLISFRSGQGELFRNMLLHGAEFKTLRESLEEEGYPFTLPPSMTIILVRPEQYLDTVNSPSLRGKTLKRYNVIVAESEEYLLQDVLLRLAQRRRPRENRGERLQLDLDSHDCKFVTKRSFVCEAPRLLVAGTVAQSTTEAHRSSPSASVDYFSHSRGVNPRRLGYAHSVV